MLKKNPESLAMSFILVQLPPIKENTFRAMITDLGYTKVKVRFFTAKMLGAIFKKRGLGASTLFHSTVIVLETTSPDKTLDYITKEYSYLLVLGIAHGGRYYHSSSLKDLATTKDLVSLIDSNSRDLTISLNYTNRNIYESLL